MTAAATTYQRDPLQGLLRLMRARQWHVPGPRHVDPVVAPGERTRVELARFTGVYRGAEEPPDAGWSDLLERARHTF